jgi:hypothetical protein
MIHLMHPPFSNLKPEWDEANGIDNALEGYLSGSVNER